MNEHPIIFGGDMVKAILEGRKTQTRRIMPIMPIGKGYKPCQYGVVGDLLWVRESWTYFGDKDFQIPKAVMYRANYDGLSNPYPFNSPIFMPKWASRIWLEITGIRVEKVQEITEEDAKAEGVRPNCVGAEYVEDIGWIVKPANLCPACKPIGICQFINEWIDYSNIDGCGNPCDSAKESYQTLWDSLNAKRGYGWEKNPWVWVLEFRKADDR